MDNPFYYQLIPSRFGHAGMVWRQSSDRPPIVGIFLPREISAVEDAILRTFPGAQPGSRSRAGRLKLNIKQYLEGKPVDFTLEELDMNSCSAFQREVLTRTWRVPRGKVVTYSRLADLIGHSGAARTVGTALARNPFPLVIPCHRVVRSGGELGDFGGGTGLKQTLLAMEGVEFDAEGKVSSPCLTR